MVTQAQLDNFVHEFDTNIYPKESAAFSVPPDRDGSDAQLPGLLGQPNQFGITPDYYEDGTQPFLEPSDLDYEDGWHLEEVTIPVNGMLSVEGIRFIFTSFVPNFAGFGVIAVTFVRTPRARSVRQGPPVILTGSSKYQGDDQSLRRWDAAAGKELDQWGGGDRVWAVAFSADGTLALTAGSDNTLRLWKLSK